MQEVLPVPVRQRCWKADSFNLLTLAMGQEYPRLVQCLQSGEIAVKLGYVKGGVVWERLSQLQYWLAGVPADEVTEKLVGLLRLEFWLQVSFNGKTNSQGGSGIWERRLRTTMAGKTR